MPRHAFEFTRNDTPFNDALRRARAAPTFIPAVMSASELKARNSRQDGLTAH